jgi:predicted DNA repair protein MutK
MDAVTFACQKTLILQITILLLAVFQYVFSGHVSERNSHHNDSGKVSPHCSVSRVSSNWSAHWMPSHRPTHKALFTTLYHKMSHNVPSVSERLLTVCTVYGLSAVWILEWRLSGLWVTKRLLHTEQWWGRSLAGTLGCLVKAPYCVNVYYMYDR